ncbi:hypothetical protein DYB38_010517, partial [Aphanomyces astaci]
MISVISIFQMVATIEQIREAVQRVLSGESKTAVVRSSQVKRTTLFKFLKATNNSEVIERKKSRRKPSLPNGVEQDLVSWIAAMQRAGCPVTRHDIMMKAQQIVQLHSGITQNLGRGWYQRFSQRHQELSDRIAQSLTKARNNVDKDGIILYFNRLLKACLAFNCSPSDIYNVDETSFKTKNSSKKVVAIRGSQSVWATEKSVPYHLTIVAAVAADGTFVPPAFILPGLTCEAVVLDECAVHDAVVTTAPKAFINAHIFNNWLETFGEWKMKYRGCRPAVLSVTKLIDYSANPCEDFYQYACGAWHKDAVIPPGKTSIAKSFDKIAIQNEVVLNKILSENKPKLGEFYSSCLDTATLTSLGLSPLADSFKAIRSANTTLDLLVVAGQLVKNGIPAFVDIVSRGNANDTTKNALFGFQAPLSLARTYYNNSARWASIEADYKVYIASVLQLAGFAAEQAAAAVPQAEEMEAVVSAYTAFTFHELDQKYPLLVGSWLKGNGFNVRDESGGATDWVGFYSLDYFDKTEALLKNTSLEDLRTIVEYKLIHASSTHLTPEFRTANWNLFGKKIGGQKTEPTRQKFCLGQTSATVGELLGKYFLEVVWSANTAKTADELVKALRSSFSTGIATADWLDNSTRTNAQTKLSKFVHLLGGSEKPQLYPTLTFDTKSYLNNRWKVSQVNLDTNLKLNGQPVDKRRFSMSPQTVNAYYSPSVNQIVFPAGILQNPFFDGQFDAAQNFGAIGMVIGHEITHGFDNRGRSYDGDGNLNPWWSNVTSVAFNNKAQCIVDQYAKFVVKSEVTGAVLGNLNGRLTLGETIADNGGLKTSFRAYHEYLKKYPSQYTEETGDKLFY